MASLFGVLAGDKDGAGNGSEEVNVDADPHSEAHTGDGTVRDGPAEGESRWKLDHDVEELHDHEQTPVQEQSGVVEEHGESPYRHEDDGGDDEPGADVAGQRNPESLGQRRQGDQTCGGKNASDKEECAMPLIEVKVIEGVFSHKQKQEIITKLTDAMVSIEGENLRPYTLVVLDEVKSGDWGVGGNSLTNSQVKELAAAGRKA